MSAQPLALARLRVLDLSWGISGPLVTMLLSDRGAEVVKIEPPTGDPFRASAGYTVWNRGKRSIVLDLHTPDGVSELKRLAAEADVLVESFSPGTTTRLGIDEATMRAINPALIYCSITGYGRHGANADRPGYDGLVQARMGLQIEQPGLRPGPVFLHTPMPSMGAAFLASIGIRAALFARSVTGLGQWVETSLAQGVLLWTTQIWKRASNPTPALHDLWRYRDLPPTPCFEASDGNWFHPMPGGIPAALKHVGRDPGEINLAHVATGSHADRSTTFKGMRDLYLTRPRDEWVAVLQAADTPCQPVGRAEDAFFHPQLIENGAVTIVDLPGIGSVTQFGRAFRMEGEDNTLATTPPPALGADTAAGVLDGWSGGSRFEAHTARRREGTTTPPATSGPLAGLRVLDFGAQLAGPFAPMMLSDLGADVIKIDPFAAVGGFDDSTWVACQRGKRSVVIDLKSAAGQDVVKTLVAGADVVHWNLRTGVADRLGFGYEQVKAINPNIVWGHVTAYGGTGPLATYPGVDQMGQAICGHEWEQGATDNGGHPTWYRFGMCDASAAMCSVMGVLEALLTCGDGSRRVDADIITGALLMASNAFVGPDSLEHRPHLDGKQMGLSPLYRLYETSDGWLCIAVLTDTQWSSLCNALAQPELTADPRFIDNAARAANATELAIELEKAFTRKSAQEWFAVLDAHAVPCEISTLDFGDRIYDDPDVVANGWVAGFDHPTWGHLEQAGKLLDLSATPVKVQGPPPVRGAHTREVLLELGYSIDDLAKMAADGVIS